MKIATLMSKKLITLAMDEPLSKAKDIFESQPFHHLLITDDEGLLAGIITDKDLYKHLSPTIGTSQETHRDTSLMQKKLHQIMERELITAKAEFSISEALLIFYDHNISCLPIVDKDKKPIGIITWRDILKVLALQYRKNQVINS